MHSLEHFSSTTRAYHAIYSSKNLAETQTKVATHGPKYNGCDSTLTTPYDSKFKDAVKDQKLAKLLRPVAARPVQVVEDKAYTAPTSPIVSFATSVNALTSAT